MKIEFELSDQRARDIEYYFRKRYKMNANTSLTTLISMAVRREMGEAAKEELAEIRQSFERTQEDE